jgi:hypothetical protein
MVADDFGDGSALDSKGLPYGGRQGRAKRTLTSKYSLFGGEILIKDA